MRFIAIHCDSSYLESSGWFGVVAILMNDTFCLLQIAGFRFGFPPIDKITVEIELTSLIVKTVRNFVADDEADCTIIHVTWSISREELTLQYASGEFCMKHKIDFDCQH